MQQCQQQESSPLRSASASDGISWDEPQQTIDWSEDLYGLLDFDINDTSNFALDTSIYDNAIDIPTLGAVESMQCPSGHITDGDAQYNLFVPAIDHDCAEPAAGLLNTGVRSGTQSKVMGIASHSPATSSNSQTASSSPSSLLSDRRRTAPSSSMSDQSQSEPSYKVQKRKRNTEAARRYRQRKEDKVAQLEEALKAMTDERNELSLKLARAEAETNVLRSMFKTS